MKAFLLGIALCLGALASTASRANSLVFCDKTASLTAAQKDRLLRFGDTLRALLDESGASVAIVSRSGLDLSRFNVRYSHAGISLRYSDNGAWSVRQLYYACDEQVPRIYDQGLAGFLLGNEDASPAYVSVVLMAQPEAGRLEHAALDKASALKLLASNYSANAYPFSLAYQNCNQWLAELLASAWGDLPQQGDARTEAQGWLKAEGYEPARIDLEYRAMMWLSYFVPLVHRDDHPAQDIDDKVYQVSMPASIEAFVRKIAPASQRIEMCLRDEHLVIHRGWDEIQEDCVPQPGDEIVSYR
jgi:hypothetical protein